MERLLLIAIETLDTLLAQDGNPERRLVFKFLLS